MTRTAPLKQIAPPTPSLHRFRAEERVWQLGLEHIEADTGRLVACIEAPAAQAGNSTYVFDDGNVLYSKLRPYLNKVICPDRLGIATTELVPLRPDPDRLDKRYLCYYLRSPIFVSFISGQVSGAKMPRVNMDIFWKHEIPLPPLDEQIRIAAILDKADALRRKRAEALRLTDQFLQSVFLDMFGDPVTNPKGWETVTFGDKQVGTLDRGRSRHRPRNAPELLGGPYPLIQTGDAANCRRYITKYTQTYSEVGLQQSKMWPAGTLCITIAANIAKTGILTFDACFPDSVVGFTPGTHVTTEYVQFWLSFLQSILEDSAPESAQKNINLDILRKQEIPLPDRRLQDKFTEIVKKTDASMVHMDIAETEACNLFDSTTQRAFRGEL